MVDVMKILMPPKPAPKPAPKPITTPAPAHVVPKPSPPPSVVKRAGPVAVISSPPPVISEPVKTVGKVSVVSTPNLGLPGIPKSSGIAQAVAMSNIQKNIVITPEERSKMLSSGKIPSNLPTGTVIRSSGGKTTITPPSFAVSHAYEEMKSDIRNYPPTPGAGPMGVFKNVSQLRALDEYQKGGLIPVRTSDGGYTFRTPTQQEFNSMTRLEQNRVINYLGPESKYYYRPQEPGALAEAIESDTSKLPPVLRELSFIGQGASRAAYSLIKPVFQLAGKEKWFDTMYAVGTGVSTSTDYKEMGKNVGRNLGIVYTKGPQDYSPYSSKNPYVFGGGLVTDIALMYTGGKGISGGLGYVSKLGPTGAKFATGLNRGLLLYTGKSLVEGGKEAYESGELPKYLLIQGSQFGALSLGGIKSFKEGEIKGLRTRFLANVSTETEKARLKDLFRAIDESKSLSSRDRKALSLHVVENLKGDLKQQEALTNALNSKELKGIKIVMGGSAVEPTFGLASSPHDIDIYIKEGMLRPKLRPFISDITSSERTVPKGSKIELYRPSNVDIVKGLFTKKGVKLGLYDIHDLPRPGSSLPQFGTGLAEKPIRTATGSVFKWQIPLSEQAQRKWASVFAPLHQARGKDVPSALRIAETKFTDKTFVSELKKWSPEIGETHIPSLGKEAVGFKGPSYYELHPTEAPRASFTWLERQIRKYGAPVTQEDIFTKEALEKYVKPEAEPYRPKFIEKSKTPDWAKGVKFFSGAYPSAEAGTFEKRLFVGSFLGLKGYPKSTPSSVPKTITVTKYPIYVPPSPSPKQTPYVPHYVEPVRPSYVPTVTPIYVPPPPSPYTPPSYTPSYTPPYYPTYPKPEYPTYPKYPSYPGYPREKGKPKPPVQYYEEPTKKKEYIEKKKRERFAPAYRHRSFRLNVFEPGRISESWSINRGKTFKPKPPKILMVR